MAADLKEAVDNFLATSASFRTMFDLASQLQAVGDADRLAAEAENRRAVAEEATAKAQSAATETIEAAKREAQRLVDEAERKAGEISARAQEEATTITATAQQRADSLLADAEARADQSQALAAASEEAARDSEKRFAMAQGQLADVNAKIASARETIAGLLKG